MWYELVVAIVLLIFGILAILPDPVTEQYVGFRVLLGLIALFVSSLAFIDYGEDATYKDLSPPSCVRVLDEGVNYRLVSAWSDAGIIQIEPLDYGSYKRRVCSSHLESPVPSAKIVYVYSDGSDLRFAIPIETATTN